MAIWTDLKREANFIGGAWVAADSGTSEPVTDPATGEIIGTVPDLGAPESTKARQTRSQSRDRSSPTRASGAWFAMPSVRPDKRRAVRPEVG